MALVVEDVATCCQGRPRLYSATEDPGPAPSVPVVEDLDPAVLPDLQTLPAFNMDVSNRRSGRSRLEFASMVWVAGASPLVVEGFRRPDEEVMDAYQYFYDRDELLARAPVGTLEFDRRDGHRHWHFLQFAAYRMIDADDNEVVRSAKQSFCLTPTDVIDLTVEHAALRESPTELDSACGRQDALWIREVLPLGWGDTYNQVAGQAFDITDLPNGRYFVEVEANPLTVLYEENMSNNSVLRAAILGGRPGARTVTTFPWNGLNV